MLWDRSACRVRVFTFPHSSACLAVVPVRGAAVFACMATRVVAGVEAPTGITRGGVSRPAV
eukprot:4352480-Prymnesium_polylepis.1